MENKISTIRIHEDTKLRLELYRVTSYEQAINDVLDMIEN